MSTGERITQTIYVTAFVFSLIGIAFYLFSYNGKEFTRWQVLKFLFLRRYFPQFIMSKEEPEDDEETDEIEDEINDEIAGTSSSVAENRGETFSSAETRRIQAETLARLVINGYIKHSEAVKIGMDSESGDAYSRDTRILKAEIERQKQRYRPLTEEQEKKRRLLELERG